MILTRSPDPKPNLESDISVTIEPSMYTSDGMSSSFDPNASTNQLSKTQKRSKDSSGNGIKTQGTGITKNSNSINSNSKAMTHQLITKKRTGSSSRTLTASNSNQYLSVKNKLGADSMISSSIYLESSNGEGVDINDIETFGSSNPQQNDIDESVKNAPPIEVSPPTVLLQTKQTSPLP